MPLAANNAQKLVVVGQGNAKVCIMSIAVGIPCIVLAHASKLGINIQQNNKNKESVKQ